MSLTETFIARLEGLKPGDLARLRQLPGKPLDHTLPGFDLFTGLWWPLRQSSQKAPERRSAWLVAKLYGAYPILHIRDPASCALPRVLGRAEPRGYEQAQRKANERFRQRFDILILAPLARLEPSLRWALGVVREAVGQRRERGVDWVQMLDDLWSWDRPSEGGSDTREKWAREYLEATAERSLSC